MKNDKSKCKKGGLRNELIVSFWQRNQNGKSGPRRDFVAVELEMAAERPACPLCTIAGKSRHRFLWALLWEYVNDAGMRRRFVDGGGFCRDDTRLLLDIAQHEIGTVHGVAILYQNLVDVLAAALSPEPPYSLSWIDIQGRRFEPGKHCPACAAAAQSLPLYVGLLSRVPDPQGQKWDSAFPLCCQHFQMALRLTGAGMLREALVIKQRDGILRLGDQLKRELSRQEDFLDALWKRFLAAACPAPGAGPGFHPAAGDGPATGTPQSCPLCRTVAPYRLPRPEELAEPTAAAAFICHGHVAGAKLSLAGKGAAEWIDYLAGTALAELSAAPKRRPGRYRSRKDAISAPESVLCPSCLAGARGEQQALEGIVTRWEQGTAPDGLICLNHLGPVLERLNPGLARELLARVRSELVQLSADLEEFIDSRDYRFKGTPSPGAKTATRRALRFFVGMAV